MPEKVKDNRFVFTVLKSLEPMGKIDCLAIEDSTIGIYKDNVMFGFILDSDLYLRTDEEDREIYTDRFVYGKQKYNKLKKIFVGSHDNFLQIATKAYWVACGKH